MEKPDYYAEISASIKLREAFEAVKKIGKWWTANLDGRAENVGDSFTVHFGETYVTFSVEEMVKDKKLLFAVTDSYLPWLEDKTEWTGTSLLFKFTANEDGITTINFTHEGLIPEAECYNNCVKGWDFYFKNSLYHLLTTGTGKPDTPASKRD